MVIDNFDLLRVPVVPDKAYAPLVVDADAMLSGAAPDQRLKPVARWRSEILQLGRGIQIPQLAPRHREQVGWEALELPPSPAQTAAVRLSLNDTIIPDT